ncbi:MAG: hypothetical protein ACK52I_26210 [Pseudomonadota bacterium]
MSDIIEVISDNAQSTVIEVIERGPAGPAGAGGVTVREVDGTPSATVTTLEFPNGRVTIDGSKATIDVGSSLTVREVDGTPTGTATELVLPNGSLSFTGSVATLSYVLPTDSRLADSREWTAETISQAEAEAGIATTRRAFTAERVRQAIVGWWTEEDFGPRLGVVYDIPNAHVALECADNEWNFFDTTTRDNLRTALQAAAATHTHDASAITAGTLADARLSANIPRMVGGLIQASNLPSYVDDVLEFANLAGFPITGETGKIYVALNTNLTYRWSGSAYVEISPSTAVWGSISGTLSSQTDLQSALNGKLNTSIGSTADLILGTGTAGAIETRTAAQVRTLLGLATTDSPTFAGGTFNGFIRVPNTGTATAADIRFGSSPEGLYTISAGFAFSVPNFTPVFAARYTTSGWGLGLTRDAFIGWGAQFNATSGHDLLIGRDAANTYHQRNGTAGQVARWAKTWTSATNFETFEIDAASDASNYRIGSRIGSAGGTTRGLQFGAYGAAGAWSRWLGIDSNSLFHFGSNANAPIILTFNGSAITSNQLNGRGLTIFGNNNVVNSSHIGLAGDTISQTSGTNDVVLLSNTFSPTSGSANYNAFRISATINQTGDASGISRGVNVAPSLTAAADWRSFDTNVNTGFAYHSSGTAPSRLGGGLTWVPFTTSQTPATNGQFTIEMTSNTAGNLVYRGSDGTTRRMALTFS